MNLPGKLLLFALVCWLVTVECAGGEDNAELARRVKLLEKQVEQLREQVLEIGVIAETEVIDCLDEWRDRKAELLALDRRMSTELAEQFEKIKTLRNTISLMAEGDEKSRNQAELMKLEQQYAAKRDTGRQELLSKRRRYIDTLYSKVAQCASDYAKEHGFDLILRGNDLTFRSQKIDNITERIIQIMNAQYAAEKRNEQGSEIKTPEPAEPQAP